MSLKSRVNKLEKSAGLGDGRIYVVHEKHGVFTVEDNGEKLEMNEVELGDWERSKGENDYLILVRYAGAKENENV